MLKDVRDDNESQGHMYHVKPGETYVVEPRGGELPYQIADKDP
jgi:hypothetical protein